MATIFMTSTIFDPDHDAKELHDSFEDPVIRIKEIAYILANRSNAQRQLIKKHFKETYNKELQEFWGKEVSGDFLEVVNALLTQSAEYDAATLYNCMKGLGTDEKTLMDVLFTRSFEELQAIKVVYERQYKKSLEKAVHSETSGDFRKLLEKVLTTPRSTGPVDEELAILDAEKLYKSGEGKMGTDESVFIELMSSRSFAHLSTVFLVYEKQHNKSFEAAVKKETSGDFQKALLHIVSLVENRGDSLAEELHRAINSKKGKDDVIRLIVGHCERDLAFAKEPFKRIENKTLVENLEEKMKDDFLMALLTLV